MKKEKSVKQNIKEENVKKIEKKEKIKVPKEKKSFKEKLKGIKIWGKWYTPAIIALLLIALFVFIMYILATMQLPTFDITTNGKYTITDITKDYINNVLEKDVKIYLMYQKVDNAIPTTVDGIESFLRNYETYSNGKIKLELVDVSQNKEIATKYGVDFSNSNTGSFSVVYESGSNFKKIDEYGFYMREMYEQVSTNTILEITSDKQEKVYFVEGYSQASLENSFSILSTYIQKEIFMLEKLQLKLVEKIPEDASVVVVSALQTDLDELALNKLLDFYERGGKIIVMQQYAASNFPNLQKLVGTVGIKFNNDIVYEGSQSNRLSVSSTMIVPLYVDTVLKPAMEKRQGNVILAEASSLTKLSDSELGNKKVITTNLLTTTEKGWANPDTKSYNANKPDSIEAGTQIVGMMGQKAPQGNHDGRIVVYGNDYFLSDQFINKYGMFGTISNIDFFVENLIMLTGRKDVVNIDKDRAYPVYKVYTPTLRGIIEVVSYSIPALVLVIGLVIWIYRKNRK